MKQLSLIPETGGNEFADPLALHKWYKLQQNLHKGNRRHIMGMFDKETQLKNAPFAENGQSFTLHTGEYVGRVKSADYGENDKALVKAGPEHETFVVFGVMAQQIQRMEDGELPTQVRIGQDGKAKIFVQA